MIAILFVLYRIVRDYEVVVPFVYKEGMKVEEKSEYDTEGKIYLLRMQ